MSISQVRQNFEKKFKHGSIDECWEWTGFATKSRNGPYGQVFAFGRPRGAHRVSYMIYRGSIPEGMHVCHKCDNTLCVNPNHLFLGTRSDNMRDMWEKGRHASLARSGAENPGAKLTEELVRALRRGDYSGRSHTSIATELGVSASAVRMAINGDTWRHVNVV